VSVHFYHPFENQLPGYVRTIARDAGYSIDEDAVSYLIDVLGGNLALIEAELNKAYNFIGDAKKITVEDVRQSVGDFGLAVVFEFIDAAAMKDIGRALDKLNRLLRDGEQPLMILGMMASHWRKLLTAREMADTGKSQEDIARSMKLNFANKKTFLTQLGRLKQKELETALGIFHSADISLKNSSVASGLVMEKLVLELGGRWAA